jgi:hypothetical protein
VNNLEGEWITRNGTVVTVRDTDGQGWIADLKNSSLSAFVDDDGLCQKDHGYDLMRRRRDQEKWS